MSGTPDSPSERRYRFGQFDFEALTGRLWRNGLPVRLQTQPALVLAMLLAANGDVVSREELQRALWPDESFGEFDTGLNTAIKKLRQALDDSPQNPRFVETLPRLGYRFLAPVTQVQATPAAVGMAGIPAVDLPEVPGTPTVPAQARPQLERDPGQPRSWMRWVGAAVLAVLALAAVVAGERWVRGEATVIRRPLRLQFTLPPNQEIPISSRGKMVAIAPDGSEVFYVAAVAGTRQVFRRRLDATSSELLPGTDGANAIAIAPDGKRLLFHRNGEVWLTDTRGLTSRKIAPPDDTWVAAPSFCFGTQGDFYVAGAAGGTADEKPETRNFPGQERASQEIYWSGDGQSWRLEMPALASPRQRGFEFQFPHQALDSGELLLSAVWAPRDRAVYLHNRKSGATRLLANPGMGGHVTTDGVLLYFWQGDLLATGIHERSKAGVKWKVASDVLSTSWAGAQAGVSGNGTLVYLEAPKPPSVQLVWVDRTGRETQIPAPARPYSLLDLDAAGDRLLVGLSESMLTRSVWSHSLKSGDWVRLLADAPDPAAGIWSPGGGHALVNSYLGELRFPNIIALAAGGNASPWRVSPSEHGQFPLSWPSPAAPLVFVRSGVRGTGVDVGLLYSLQDGARGAGGASPSTEPARGGPWREDFLEMPGDQRHPSLSPDGRWLAFTQGGIEETHIRVCALPGCAQPVTVPHSKGGVAPLWDETGRTLFFRLEQGVYAARFFVEANGAPRFESPTRLFEGDYAPANFWNREMLWDSRRKRFLLTRARQGTEPIRQIHVVVNWRSILESAPGAE